MTSDGTGWSLRLDTDHAVEQLMTTAAGQISSSVQVRIDADCVVISGTTESWYEKQLVQESLRAVCSTYRISNRISVPVWA